jgi:PAS domain S-box-containing protein
METTGHMGQLFGLAQAVAGASEAVDIVAAALPLLREIADAEAALVVATAEPTGLPGTHRTTASDGIELAVDGLPSLADAGPELTDLPVPEGWREQGISRVVVRGVPGHLGLLLLAWREAPAEVDPTLELALAHVDTAIGKAVAQDDLVDLALRVNNAQHLANMGDYDWHIPTDTNRWSDQLFRIYGHEPQSFNPSYERFLSLVHPDDRERIQSLHQQAYATGEHWQVIERIVRPDGEVRHLLTNGEVVMGPDNVPVRMRGTCIDVTERVEADAEKARLSAQFQSLVESAPDAILVLDAHQQILNHNPQARDLLGEDPSGHAITEVLPTWPATEHVAAQALGLDGRSLVLDLTVAAVNQEEDIGDAFVALYLRDARPRLEQEAVAARLGEAHLRRRQALEINDNVVQGLVAASYALDQGEMSTSRAYLDQTLSAARAMMDDLLEPLDGEGLQPGDLVRTTAASIGLSPDTAASAQEENIEQNDSHRVLVVDDADDLRMLLRARMETRNGLTVVGEAADGLSAVELASELQPDLVMLDLAMPRMDGLEALPLIRAAVPGVRVIVLSGFNQSTLAEKAIEAGADEYVVKGGSMRQLLELVETVLDEAAS